MPLTPRTIRSRPSRLEQTSQLGVFDVGVLGEIGGLVRDLAPRRRDELAHDPRRRLLLGDRQPLERTSHVLADDCARTADRAQRREPQLARAGLPLALPQTLQHELEVGRLDAGIGRRLVEHRLDERVLGRELLAGQLAVAGERAEDGGLSRFPVEPVEAQQVREELGNPAGELVELREGVVAQREQDVDAQAGAAQELWQRRTQWPFETVVEDVLLEVVEQQMELPALLRDSRHRVDEPRGRAELAALGMDRSDQPSRGILGPRVVHDDRCTAQLAQPAGHAGTEERALADAARSVENGEPAREHVRRHGGDLALAAEEEQRVELGVLERREALVRALRKAAHSALSSTRSSSAT